MLKSHQHRCKKNLGVASDYPHFAK